MKRAFLTLAVIAWPLALPAQTADRIVSIGGPVTEIIFALGQGDRVVARDSTSLYPPEAAGLPDVGYMRQLSAEGVLSAAPDLIVTRDTAGPPEVLAQLRGASVPMVEVHDGFTPGSVLAAIRTVGAALGQPDRAETLATEVAAEFAALAQEVSTGPHPRVMFVLSNQGGRLTAAGRDTGADGIIALAGGLNVLSDAFEGYRIVSDEAIIEAAPDVIVMLEPTGARELDSGHDTILTLPATRRTAAGQDGALILLNAAALGFGPRTASFALELRRALLMKGS